MTAAQRFIAGLSLVADVIDTANFYNSSECASFQLRRPLTAEEQGQLTGLGFEYDEFGLRPNLSFQAF